jgi:YHS domain-containing protein
MKRLLVFVFALALSVAAAWYRPGDSAHAMGLVSVKGGQARHPVHLPGGRDRYTLVVTGTVLPPYQGDARVVVEGEPGLSYDVYGSDPVVDLGLRRRPGFDDQTLIGLRPKDRFTLWVVMRPSEVDPVCGRPKQAGFLAFEHDGRNVWLCSQSCLDEFSRDPDRFRAGPGLAGTYAVTFHDTATDRTVLEIPVIFGGTEGQHHEG